MRKNFEKKIVNFCSGFKSVEIAKGLLKKKKKSNKFV